MRESVLRAGPPLRRALLLMVVFATPLIFLYNLTYDPVNTPKLAFLILVVGLVAATKLLEVAAGAALGSARALLVPAALVVVPLTTAWLFSPYRSFGVLGQYNRYQGLLPYVMVAAFGLLAVDAFRGRPLPLAWALLLAGAAAGLYGALDTFGLAPFVWAAGSNAKTLGLAQTASTLGNPNFFGGFMCIVLPVGLGVWLTDRERRDRAAVCLVLTAVGLFVSFSQGAWLAAAAGIAACLGVVLNDRYNRAKLAGVAVALCLGLAGMSLVILALFREQPKDTQSTAVVRGWAWEAAVGMAADHPIVGRGPNAFAIDGVRYRPAEEARVASAYQTDDPHSVFLSYLTAGGVIAAAGFLLLAIWIVRRGLSIDAGVPAALLGAGFFGGAIAYLAQSMLSLDEISIRIALWTALAGLALTASPVMTESETRSARSSWIRVISIPASLILVAGTALYAGRIVVADRHILRAYRDTQDNLPEEAVREYDAALSLRPDLFYRALAARTIGELGNRRGEMGLPYIERMRAEFSFIEEYPLITAITAEADLLHAWAGNVDPSVEEEAIGLYERALAIDPANPLLAAKVSDAYIQLSRVDIAFARLLPLADEQIPLARYWGTLAFVQAKLGHRDEGLTSLAKAVALDPRDPRALQARDLLLGRSG